MERGGGQRTSRSIGRRGPAITCGRASRGVSPGAREFGFRMSGNIIRSIAGTSPIGMHPCANRPTTRRRRPRCGATSADPTRPRSTVVAGPSIAPMRAARPAVRMCQAQPVARTVNRGMLLTAPVTARIRANPMGAGQQVTRQRLPATALLRHHNRQVKSLQRQCRIVFQHRSLLPTLAATAENLAISRARIHRADWLPLD